jgi:hypothetical protein
MLLEFFFYLLLHSFQATSHTNQTCKRVTCIAYSRFTLYHVIIALQEIWDGSMGYGLFLIMHGHNK